MMKSAPEKRPDGRGLRVAVLHSAFNAGIVKGLHDGALDALRSMNVKDVRSFEVSGAFELPLAAQSAARSGRFDALIALAAVMRGETDHYDHIAREAARGLTDVALATGVPVGFGVLTVRKAAHAVKRSAPGADNKGAEAARAAIAQALLLAEIRRAGKARRSAATGRRGRS
ncbi:MAG: 6,7-dimethyl-8-ribityllumazine synthase [Vicinamibacteria bacterium]|nr:6,7-dimethyl-8-ribityllumazine synthase [Vicinamibacteria bacterium]